ncbi:MAG: AAA family ATPase [Bacteroidia bacterium]
METPKFDTIEELHEYVFQMLYAQHKKDNSFMFTMRDVKDFKGKKKDITGNKWFYGEENSAAFSFWAFEEDYTNYHCHDGLYPLYFSIDIKGRLQLRIWDDIFSELRLSESFYYEKIKSIKKNDEVLLVKHYSSISLSSMLYDKEKIDTALSRNTITSNSPISFIDTDIFDSQLETILKVRRDIKQKKKELQVPIEPKHRSADNYSPNSWVNRYRLADNYLLSFSLNSLTLLNIGHFSSIHLDLSKKITCFIGENGSGKSTILRALGLALAGTNEKRINAKHSNIVNLLKIKGLDAESKTENYEFKGEICLTYNENLQNKVQLQFQYGDLVVKEEGDYKNVQDLYYFPQLILAFPQIQGKNENGNGHSLIKQNRANVKDVRNLIYNEPDNRFAEFSDWIINLFATSNEKKASGKENAPMEAKMIEKVFQIVSEVTAQKVDFVTVNHETETVWVRTADAPEGIPLSLISQGYNNVFGWVGYFMKRLAEVNPTAEDFTQCRALLLIDEMDTYLHPKWQENILQAMLKNFPNTQFVLTTHSIFIPTSIPHSEITLYRIEKKGEEMVATEIMENIYGADRNEGAEMLGTKSRLSEVLERINELFNLIYDNKVVEAESYLQQRFSDMNLKDEELIKAQKLIEMKKRLLKL